MFYTQIQNIISSQDLIWYFVKSDIKSTYEQKLLGFIWILLEPLLLMAVYTLLVVVFLDRGGPQYPALLFSALLSWQWYTYSLSSAVTSISAQGSIIQTASFPKIVLPLSRVFVGSYNYMAGILVLLPVAWVFNANFGPNLIWLPGIVIIQMLFTTAICVLFSTIGVFLSDLENITSFMLRLWFYMSPGLYNVADVIPNRFTIIYMLNPIAPLFVSYKNVIVRGQAPTRYLFVTLAISLVLLLVSLQIFDSEESEFAKLV